MTLSLWQAQGNLYLVAEEPITAEAVGSRPAPEPANVSCSPITRLGSVSPPGTPGGLAWTCVSLIGSTPAGKGNRSSPWLSGAL